MSLTTNLEFYASMDSDFNSSISNLSYTNNGVGLVTGKINDGGNFGGNDYIRYNSRYFEYLHNGSSTTFALWMKKTVGQNATIFNNTVGGDRNGLEFIINSNNDISYVIGRSPPYPVIQGSWDNTYPDDGNWHFVVVVYDYTNNSLKLYIDAVQNATTFSRANAHGSGSSNYSYGDLGARKSATFFNGIMDEVGIWSRALTFQEVSDLYNSGSGNQYPFTGSSGWAGKLFGVNPNKIEGTAIANISKVDGV